MRWLEPASWRTFLLQRELRTLLGITHRSRFCSRGRKAIFEPLRDASHARTGMARLPTSPIIFTTKPRRACWLQPDTPRTSKSLRAEAERMARSGVREITLIGQDTTCYGEDFGLKDGLALLLEKLADIEDMRWIRFLYAYPNKI